MSGQNREGGTGKAGPARRDRQGGTGKAGPARWDRQGGTNKAGPARWDRQGGTGKVGPATRASLGGPRSPAPPSSRSRPRRRRGSPRSRNIARTWLGDRRRNAIAAPTIPGRGPAAAVAPCHQCRTPTPHEPGQPCHPGAAAPIGQKPDFLFVPRQRRALALPPPHPKLRDAGMIRDLYHARPRCCP